MMQDFTGKMGYALEVQNFLKQELGKKPPIQTATLQEVKKARKFENQYMNLTREIAEQWRQGVR